MASGILIDTAVVHRLLEAKIEAELGGQAGITVLHLARPRGETAGHVLVRVASLRLERHPRRRPDEDQDQAQVAVRVEISIPEQQTEGSILAVGSALAAVAAALDHALLLDPNPGTSTPVHRVHLEGVTEEITSGNGAAGVHQIVAAVVTVGGIVVRTVGNTRENHLTP